MERIHVLIADDHPIFRDGLRALLESVDDMLVVGEAGSGESAVAQSIELQPDVVLMDIQMGETNGVEATRQIVRASPQIKVLILTMFEDDDSVFAAVRSGARGYLLKGSRQEDVLRAIQAVASDEAIFGPQIAQRLIHFFADRQASAPSDIRSVFPQLTGREYEILELIAQRLDNAEIAARLVLSQKTVRNHVSNIFTKLQVADRTEAILAARAVGLGKNKRQ